MRYDVIDRQTGECVESLEVPEGSADRLLDGLVRKMDFKRFFVAIVNEGVKS